MPARPAKNSIKSTVVDAAFRLQVAQASASRRSAFGVVPLIVRFLVTRLRISKKSPAVRLHSAHVAAADSAVADASWRPWGFGAVLEEEARLEMKPLCVVGFLPELPMLIPPPPPLAPPAACSVQTCRSRCRGQLPSGCSNCGSRRGGIISQRSLSSMPR